MHRGTHDGDSAGCNRIHRSHAHVEARVEQRPARIVVCDARRSQSATVPDRSDSINETSLNPAKGADKKKSAAQTRYTLNASAFQLLLLMVVAGISTGRAQRRASTQPRAPTMRKVTRKLEM